MAVRPVYYVSAGKVMKKNVEFEWFAGFSVSQKQKSVDSLHNAVKKSDSGANPLEISTKSRNPFGVRLSAFNLKYNGYFLENIFQSSKVFEQGGAYRDLLEVSPKEAKRDERLKNSGMLKCFNFEGNDWELEPKTAFYDYIYCKAVKQSLTDEEIHKFSEYNYFTDIEFNTKKSINTQAKSAALIKLMLEMYGEVPDINMKDFTAFHRAFVIC